MPIMPFKLNQDRRHHIPRQARQVTNWPAYDASLRQRGSLTVWFTDEAVEAWAAEPRTTRGGEPWYARERDPGARSGHRRVPGRAAQRRPDRRHRHDPPHYGELIVYEFPKDKLVFGPSQIDARISQNTAISQQLSLWNQHGSRVIRGNLHVIPIEDSLLYVSPLYLRAEAGQIPELKRVIAAYGDQVVMEETLSEALTALFSGGGGSPPPAGPVAASTKPLNPDRAGEALSHYDRAMEQLKAGNWAGFGAEMERLGQVLESSRHRNGQ